MYVCIYIYIHIYYLYCEKQRYPLSFRSQLCASREPYSDHGSFPAANSSNSARDSRDQRLDMGKKTQSCGSQYPQTILSST